MLFRSDWPQATYVAQARVRGWESVERVDQITRRRALSPYEFAGRESVSGNRSFLGPCGNRYNSFGGNYSEIRRLDCRQGWRKGLLVRLDGRIQLVTNQDYRRQVLWRFRHHYGLVNRVLSEMNDSSRAVGLAHPFEACEGETFLASGEDNRLAENYRNGSVTSALRTVKSLVLVDVQKHINSGTPIIAGIRG